MSVPFIRLPFPSPLPSMSSWQGWRPPQSRVSGSSEWWDANDQWDQRDANDQWDHHEGWDANDQWHQGWSAGWSEWTAVADSNVDTEPSRPQAPAGAVVGESTAVAGAVVDTESTAVNPFQLLQAAVAGPQIFDLEYFRSFRTTNTYKQHSAALKYHREMAETAGLDSVTFSNTGANPVAQIVHDKGPNFRFEGEATIPWRWQEMVAQMDEHSMQMVVHPQFADGNFPRSRGLVGCRLQKTDRYDHKRHHAKGYPEMLFVWDFVLVCEDGTQVFIHPNYSNTKIEFYRGVPEQDHELPRTGPGGTSGPGTFKYFKNKQTQATLRFKATSGKLPGAAVAGKGAADSSTGAAVAGKGAADSSTGAAVAGKGSSSSHNPIRGDI